MFRAIKWHEGWDEARQRFFYFNARTNASVWEKPNEPYVPYESDSGEDGSEDESSEEKQENTEERQNYDGDEGREEEDYDDDEEEDDDDDDEKEVPEWRQGWDEVRQLHYYFNTNTQESVWEQPREYIPYGVDDDKDGDAQEEAVDSGGEESGINEHDIRVEDLEASSDSPVVAIQNDGSAINELEKARRNHETAMREYQVRLYNMPISHILERVS